MADASSNQAFVFKLYRYDPSLAAAVIAVAVFAILTALHGWKIFRHRSLYFIPFTIGGVFQVVGYCGRIWSHFDNLSIGAFVIQAILILVAPALYAASIYMILGRLIRTIHAEALSLIPVKRLTKIFVTGDVVAFFLQACGGGIQAGGTLELFQIGEKVIIVGLFMQIAFFGFFVSITVLFHRRMLSDVRAPAIETKTSIPWKRHLCVLYTVSSIILVRSVFRVVEYLQGNDGYLISHELFLFVFDALLMALTMAIFLVFYIDDLQGQGRRLPDMDLETNGTGGPRCCTTERSDREQSPARILKGGPSKRASNEISPLPNSRFIGHRLWGKG